MVPHLVRASCTALTRGWSTWVTPLPCALGRGWQCVEWRSINFAGGRHQQAATSAKQQQAPTAATGGSNRRSESHCALEKADIGSGSVGASVFGAWHKINGDMAGKDKGDTHAANGLSSHDHANGVHVVNGLNSLKGAATSLRSNNVREREGDLQTKGHMKEHRDPRQHARDVILGGAAALQRLADTVDDTFARAVSMIEGRGQGCRVIVLGIGKSGHLARKLSATLSSTGTASFFMHASEALHGDLGGAQAGDVAILLSNSGETEEILQAAAGFRRALVKTIAITALGSNSLSAACDLCVPTGLHQELDHNGLAPTASALATMALGDALAVVLSQRSNFSKKDFSLCHPAGQLGKVASGRELD